MDIDFHSEYIANYMKAVENTEPPRLFHLWACVSTMAAALGRRVYIPFGMVGKIYPNHYILLVGPPASRKTAAMGVAYRLLKDSTNVRFAPTDTGGQRQGLIRALARGSEEAQTKEDVAALEAATADPFGLTGMEVNGNHTEEGDEAEAPIMLDRCDRHVLSAFWSELSGPLGQHNHSMMDFLVQTYDGDDYRYETTKGEVTVRETLMNIFACTTPATISITLPPTADGHGFLSRFILVHGAEVYKDVIWPTMPDASLIMSLKETLSFVNMNLRGPVNISDAAKRVAEGLYNTELDIADPRFSYYKARRFTHLLKLSLALAASRKQLTIEGEDVEVANLVLRLTEKGMSDALGQFGMSPISKLKQGILEYLRSTGGPVSASAVRAAFHRDARPQDVVEAVSDLVLAKNVVQTQNEQGTIFLSAKRVKREKKSGSNHNLAQFLTEQKDS